MRRMGLHLTILALTIFAVGFYGCSKPSPKSLPANTSTDDGNHDEHDGHNHGEQGHGDHETNVSRQTAMEKMEKGLADLSESDRASVIKQHFCPVSGQMLGTMGEPLKVTVKGQNVWICCSGCEDDLLAEPDKYLAKLKK